ncbi:MAG: cysteine desulfurase [Lentisphaerae bacterium]|nr:cysteine desulfurase [Lentisphaerota bacterium]
MSEQRRIYLDHNATAPVHPDVATALGPFLTTRYGTPSAPYMAGQEAKRDVAAARCAVKNLIGCTSGSLVFTSGGTEANNLAIKGAFFAANGRPKGHVVISAIEHPCVRETAAWLERQGVSVTTVPVTRQGQVRPDSVAKALRPETFLVAVMHANNETGVVQPIEEIASLTRDAGILFHVDGVQAAGKLAVDVEALGCDSYSVSGHKFGALKGVGGLYLRDPSSLEWIQQGGHQEGGYRAGTENVPGIVAMGKAAEAALRDLEANTAHCRAVRDVFDRLAANMPMTRLNGHPEARLPNTTNLCCLYADTMSICMALSIEGVFLGTGSACASHTQEPSYVLRAMGLSDQAAYCSVRISVGPSVSLDDAEFAAERITQAVETIRLVTAPEDIGTCGDDCPCFIETDTP